ncbi:MAG: hypothetical protein AB8B49_07900 [Nitratireductor sp.]
MGADMWLKVNGVYNYFARIINYWIIIIILLIALFVLRFYTQTSITACEDMHDYEVSKVLDEIFKREINQSNNRWLKFDIHQANDITDIIIERKYQSHLNKYDVHFSIIDGDGKKIKGLALFFECQVEEFWLLR